jgi:acyl transferase domain-containing protein
VEYTLGTGRAALSHRAAIVARDAGEARRRLEALAENAEAPGLRRGLLRPGSRPRVAFLFTGQGSQQADGRGLTTASRVPPP